MLSIHDETVKKEEITMFKITHDISDMHYHNFLELAYVASGGAIHHFGNIKTEIKKGDFFIIDYHVSHEYVRTSKEPLTVINCMFLPKFIDNSLYEQHTFQETVNNPLIRFSVSTLENDPTKLIHHDNDGIIEHLLDDMVCEYNNKLSGYKEILRAHLVEILVRTMRRYATSTLQQSNNICCIIADVQQNYMKPLSLQDYADKYFYSLSFLSRKFKSETNMSFCNFLQLTRIEESCRLLCNTNKKIDEISMLVGYSDIRYFRKLFFKYKGMTPTEFRKFNK